VALVEIATYSRKLIHQFNRLVLCKNYIILGDSSLLCHVDKIFMMYDCLLIQNKANFANIADITVHCFECSHPSALD